MANVLNVEDVAQSVNERQVQEVAVYLPADIMKLLGLSRAKTYTYLEKVRVAGRPFRVIKIGRSIRIPKQPFDAWLYHGKEVV